MKNRIIIISTLAVVVLAVVGVIAWQANQPTATANDRELCIEDRPEDISDRESAMDWLDSVMNFADDPELARLADGAYWKSLGSGITEEDVVAYCEKIT